jgi:uncharacterized protein YndB with AHSA1/START domain
MKKTIETSHIVNAPIEKVWTNISKATGVNEWLPVIKACRLDGNKRVCSTEQGDMNETILKIDNDQKIFQYSIDEQPLLPISDIIGTMQVLEQDNNTKLNWNLEFTLQDETMYETVKQAVEGMYAAGANGLETISNN